MQATYAAISRSCGDNSLSPVDSLAKPFPMRTSSSSGRRVSDIGKCVDLVFRISHEMNQSLWPNRCICFAHFTPCDGHHYQLTDGYECDRMPHKYCASLSRYRV